MIARGKHYIQSLQSEEGRRVVSVLFIMLALSMFMIGRWSAPTTVLIQQTKAEMRLEIRQQQEMLHQLALGQETNINALAARLAELQAASPMGESASSVAVCISFDSSSITALTSSTPIL